MRDLNDLCYFAAAIDHGGFSAASRALGLPKSTLSRRIAALEERLAVRLLHRSTRRLVVTEVGRQFHAHWQAILVEADAADAVAASTHVEPCGRSRRYEAEPRISRNGALNEAEGRTAIATNVGVPGRRPLRRIKPPAGRRPPTRPG